MRDRRLSSMERVQRTPCPKFVPEAIEQLEEIATSAGGPSTHEARKLLRQYEPEFSKVRAARAPHHSHS